MCCGKTTSAAAASYPREITLPNGDKAVVSSAADERVQRERYKAAERQRAATTGYTVAR